jgi:signal transduction histidine kinase
VKGPSCWPTKWRAADPEQKEIVEILDDSSRNLQKLIEQLLDYNRKLADGAVGWKTWRLSRWWIW